MFNKTLIHSPRGGDQHIRIDAELNEHRAPTDDSVKLLREMEQTARDQIVQSLTTDDNELINAEVNVFDSEFGRNLTVVISFQLNGKHFQAETTLSRKRLYDGYDYAEEVRQILVTAIADQILRQFPGFFREIFRR